MTAPTFQICQPGPKSLGRTLSEVVEFPGLLRAMIRSLIDAWPEAVYSEPIVETSFLGRRTFFVTDPHLIRELLVDHAAVLVREDFVDRALGPALGAGIITSDGAPWRNQRRTATPMFKPDRIRTFVPAMVKAAVDTRERWLAEGPRAGSVDILPEMMRTTFDIITTTMISDEHDIDVVGFGDAMETYLRQTNWKIAYSLLNAPAWMPHPGSRKGAAAARTLRQAVGQAIVGRRSRGASGSDLLGLLLEAKHPDTGIGMSNESVVDNLLTFVAAGHETTSLALSWTFRLLADHPEIEARVLAEIAALGGDLRADSLDGLAYTRQVVMEAMRLYPPAPLIVRRTLEEIKLGTTVIAAGRSVHVPVFALHRHAKLWNRPLAFDPDRFSAASQAERPRYAYMPFGAGPRVCIGMGFALTECLAILATLLPAFRFDADGSRMPEPRFRVTLRPHGGMPMFVTSRLAA